MKKESLLALGMMAVAGGIEKIESDLVVGVVLVLIGVGLIFLRGRMKIK